MIFSEKYCQKFHLVHLFLMTEYEYTGLSADWEWMPGKEKNKELDKFWDIQQIFKK